MPGSRKINSPRAGSPASPGLLAAGGARQVPEPSGLAEVAASLLSAPATCRQMGERGQHYATGHETVVGTLRAAILERLPR